MPEKEVSPIPLILSIFVAITIKSAFDHAFEHINNFQDIQAIKEKIIADPQESALRLFQTLIFIFTLFRFYWGAYRYGQEAGRPTSMAHLLFDSTGIFLLFA